MIYRITGQIQDISQSYVVICTHGISWILYTSTLTLENIQKTITKEKREYSLYTWLQVSDTALQLYGFIDTLERDVFLALITVSGIGPKGAIKILSNAHYRDITTHIIQKDVHSLARKTKVNEKKAQSIVLKLETVLIHYKEHITNEKPSQPKGLREQLIVGLIEMGYTRKNVEHAIQQTIDAKEISINTENIASILRSLIVYIQNGTFTL